MTPATLCPTTNRTQTRVAAQVLCGLALVIGCLAPALADPATQPSTLYRELGGRNKIDAVMARLFERAAEDPRTAAALQGAQLTSLKDAVAEYVCEIADGPCIYKDDPVSRPLGRIDLSETSFAVLMATLREELAAARVPVAAQAELLRRLAPPRSVVVAQLRP